MDLVKVRTPGKYEELGPRPPGTLIMGKIATVEIAGLINAGTAANGDSMTPAYYVRIDDLPAILIYEEWLEEDWRSTLVLPQDENRTQRPQN